RENPERELAAPATPATTPSPSNYLQVKLATSGQSAPVKQESPDFDNLLATLTAHVTSQIDSLGRQLANSLTLKNAPSSAPRQSPSRPQSPIDHTSCLFCMDPSHMMRECPTAQEYIRAGKVIKDARNRFVMPDSSPVPRAPIGKGLQYAIDAWHSNRARDAPPHMTVGSLFAYDDDTEPFEVGEFEICQEEEPYEAESNPSASTLAMMKTPKRSVRFELDAVELPRTSNGLPTKDKGKGKPPVSEPPVRSEVKTSSYSPPSTSSTPTVQTAKRPPPSSATKPAPQFKYHSAAEDQSLIDDTMKMILEGRLSELVTPAHLFAASPSLRARFVELLRTKRVDSADAAKIHAAILAADTYAATTDEEGTGTGTHVHQAQHDEPNTQNMAAASVPLREVECVVGEKCLEMGLIDSGAQIILVRQDLWCELGLPLSVTNSLTMEGIA
ncbi:hypothetical protein BD410DRAFT_846086, partial [Rickenella mellea]